MGQNSIECAGNYGNYEKHNRIKKSIYSTPKEISIFLLLHLKMFPEKGNIQLRQ